MIRRTNLVEHSLGSSQPGKEAMHLDSHGTSYSGLTFMNLLVIPGLRTGRNK